LGGSGGGLKLGWGVINLACLRKKKGAQFLGGKLTNLREKEVKPTKCLTVVGKDEEKKERGKPN